MGYVRHLCIDGKTTMCTQPPELFPIYKAGDFHHIFPKTQSHVEFKTYVLILGTSKVFEPRKTYEIFPW